MTTAHVHVDHVLPQTDLLQNLLVRAVSRRSLHLLAMAFRLKYPRWGSQAVLITLGLASFLDSIEWNIDDAEYLLIEYMDMHDHVQSSQLRALRFTQVRHLAELNSREEQFSMRPADDTEQSIRLTEMANQGYLLYELLDVMHAELDADDYARLRPLLEGLSLDAYLGAVHPDDRHMHPNMLDAKVMHFKQRIIDVSNQYSPQTQYHIQTPSMRA